MELGVPLRGRDVALPAQGAAANGLGDAVGVADGLDHKAGRQPLDTLVVDAVDRHPPLAGVQVRQARAGHQVDLVEMLVVGARVAVLLGTGVLGLDVLVQRAAKRHVDELQPPAHAKNGFACLRKGLDHGQVVQIAHAVAQPFLAQRLLAIAARPHVGTAVHHHTIKPLGIVRQRHVATRRLPRGAGHHHHHGAGRHDPVRDRLFDVLQRLAGEQRTRGVGMLKAGRQPDLEAARCKHAAVVALRGRCVCRRNPSGGLYRADFTVLLLLRATPVSRCHRPVA